jgi:Fe-S oxidoreductase/FAD/FMN-containing dehydrogenase
MLSTIIIGGDHLSTHPVDESELNSLCLRSDRTGRIYRVAKEIIENEWEQIESVFPKLNRCLTGYDLAHLRTADGRLDLNSVLCGSEGTLGFVNEAVLNVLPLPKFSALVNVRYASFMGALRDAKSLMSSEDRPTSIETVDDRVLMLAMEDFTWDSIAEYFPPEGSEDSEIGGVNLIEFNADTSDLIESRIKGFTEHLDKDSSAGRLGHTVARGQEKMERVYGMRKRAVGLLGNTEGEQRPIPFVEDTAVPPEHLADYIAEFRALLDAHGFVYGMFGHVDAGVLHVRPAIDMKDPNQERLVRVITDAVVELTQKYGGLLWGEHGKGMRSEYAPRVFGDLYPSLQRLKTAFDPHNQMNPGKIATPTIEGVSQLDGPRLLAIDGVPTRGQFDRQIPERTWRRHNTAVYCNGNGACFNYDLNDAMCPSWKATRERVHSPKGRASLMREWLRLQSRAGVGFTETSTVGNGNVVWRLISQFPVRVRNTLARNRGVPDFSHQVYDAMAGYLACKSYAGQCPVKVDVPDFRAQFLHAYHGRYLRPLRDYLVGGLEFVVPALSQVPALYNAVLGNRWVNRLLAGPIGMVDSPAMPQEGLHAQLRALGVSLAEASSLGGLSMAQKARSVVIVQDAFTSYFEPAVVVDIIKALSLLNIKVFMAHFSANGKPLQVHGFLRAFRQVATNQARKLRALAEFGVPLVGIDPAMTLVYRQEYVKALGPGSVPPILMLQEWLVTLGLGLNSRGLKPRDSGFKLLCHCTEKTNVPSSSSAWRQVFSQFGLALEEVDTGCCGMSGSYGHETRNLQNSKTIYRQSWQPIVEGPMTSGQLLATGYSCRSQARRFSSAEILHPLQALLPGLQESANSNPATYRGVGKRDHAIGREGSLNPAARRKSV